MKISSIRHLLGLLLLAVIVTAQIPFQMVGEINTYVQLYALSVLQADHEILRVTFGAGNALTGGTMTLDGLKITIPDNCLVTLPAIYASWQELSAPGAMPGFGSPGVTWAATVRHPWKD